MRLEGEFWDFLRHGAGMRGRVWGLGWCDGATLRQRNLSFFGLVQGREWGRGWIASFLGRKWKVVEEVMLRFDHIKNEKAGTRHVSSFGQKAGT